MKSKTFKIFSGICCILAIIFLTIIAIPLIKALISGSSAEFVAYIRSFGSLGFIMMLFIQIAQVIVAFIPGELVEFAAGTIYGAFGGLIFCLFGIFIAQSIIFIGIRYFGEGFVHKAQDSKLLQKFKVTRDMGKLKTLLFILFFIPGTPKDLLTYAAPFTEIRYIDFIFISLIARIPSVLSSTYGGSAFADRDFFKMAVIYICIGVFSVIGALCYRRFSDKSK